VIEPDWLSVALAELRTGIYEVAGPASNPRIDEYHATTTLAASSDEVPWCASFACFCLQLSGHPHTRSARARSFLDYGVGLDFPAYGAIAVFKRGGANQPGPDNHTAQGHVGFLVGDASSDEMLVLGGNQGDRVCIRPYPTRRLLGIRWPSI
jgi:uncharacterized protein (TIGR02594 family)